ncbi:MAG: enoyl-CoA hydratase/isomerase family protein [Anaerolineae bacterium]|nr:enoyl-CoA hydratase/isomerase family protein [Anaerolineae bacterium]
MGYEIRKAGIIGSGTMGSGIAALLAGVGVHVTMLDIPAPGTQPGDPPEQRNAIVLKNYAAMQKSRPAQLYSQADADLITLGNLEDDLDKLADADWIVEVVVERMDIKHQVMAQIEAVRKPGSIVSTNTSGLSINEIAAGCSEEFRQHFLGTHFFNPPRYLKLLEIIPHARTDPALLDFMTDYGTRMLGKGVVLCKDTPNFIANRFLAITAGYGINYAVRNGYTVDEVDNLTGPLIGRPKTATFRLNDLIGNDVLAHVLSNLYEAIPDDPDRDVLLAQPMATIVRRMVDAGWLGNKTDQGFYKKTMVDGERQFWTLDFESFEHTPPEKVRFASVGEFRKLEDPGARIKAMINADDRAGRFLWALHGFTLSYAAKMYGEIADDIVSMDNANKWGFNHELGPFEIWDAIGVAESIPRLEADGYPVAEWVKQMVASGHATFYRHDDKGVLTGYYDPASGGYVPMPQDKNVYILADMKAQGKEIERNDGASLIDMGDGALLLEFHTKVNAFDGDIISMGYKGLERLQSDFDALVIGNQGEHFSAGANIFLMVMAAQQGQWDDLHEMVRQGQNLFQAMRYAPKPVVTAPFGMALGGGAECTMAGARIVAHAELYVGLIEIGVGIIPAWSGTKEMMRRVINPVMEVPNADVLPHLQKVFEQIALAKVSESAKIAREMGILRPADRIVISKDHLLAEAKREALELAVDYTPLPPQKIWAAGRDALAALRLAVWGMVEAGWATEHEGKIANKLAEVLTGGDLSAPQWVPEQYILDLEREAVVSLAGELKTQERMWYMLQNGKPLRN